MDNTNSELVKAIQSTSNLLLRADTYCDVINELFIYDGYQPFDDEYLKEFFRHDIQQFIRNQYYYFNDLLKEVNKNDKKN